MEPVNKHNRTMHLLFGKQRPGRGENAEKNAGKCRKMRIAFISPPLPAQNLRTGLVHCAFLCVQCFDSAFALILLHGVSSSLLESNTCGVSQHVRGGGGGDASEGKAPGRRPWKRTNRRLEEGAKAVGGAYSWLQMLLKPTFGVRETVAGHKLGTLEGGAPPPSNASFGGGGGCRKTSPKRGC